MKFILNHRWLRPDAKLSAQVKNEVAKLAGAVRIETAEITLEKNPASSPPFSAKVHLVIPGPDLFAEDKDHTLQATVRKVLAKLSRQIQRQQKRRGASEEYKPGKKSPQSLSFQAA